MKRPRLVTGVTIIEFLLALLLAGIAIYVLLLTGSPEILNEPDAADAVHGLKIGAAVLSIPALVLLLGVYGLWKGKLWGWWLAFLVNIGIETTLVYGVLEDGWREAEREDIILAACFAIFPVLMLLPRVVKYYWRPSNPQLPPVAVAPRV